MKALKVVAAAMVAAVGFGSSAQAADKVVFFGAHPDDSEGFAGTAFLLAKDYEVHVVDLTRGELGLGMPGLKDGSTAARRTEEEKKACAVLGATPHFLGEIDGFACASDRAAEELGKLLKELQPKAVFTHWPLDNHADHVQCSALLQNALRKTGLAPEVYYYEVLLSQTCNWHPIYSVDISATMTNKVQMLRNYACQNVNDSLVRSKERQARYRGGWRSPSVTYAETFTTFSGHPVRGGVLESLKETAHLTATYDDAAAKGDEWWMERFLANRRQIRESKGEIDLVFMGDSITHYWDVGEGIDTSTEIVDMRKTYSILNCGYGCDTIRNLRWRAEHGELDGYKAKLVMLMIGTNDISMRTPAADVARQICEVVDVIRRKQPQAKILLLPIFPRGKTFEDRCYTTVREVNLIMDTVTFGPEVIRFSFSDQLVDEKGVTRAELYDEERIHLMDKGFVIWRKAVEPIFRKVCGK